MAPTSNKSDVEWLALCQRAVERMHTMFAEYQSVSDRAVTTGRGAGGDQTLVIDQAAEAIIFSELEQLANAGATFTALSEERGVVSYGSPLPLVVIDPIDGSLNAKRGLAHHAVSIAVATGETMADVQFGYVYDFGTAEEWQAQQGSGANLNGLPLEHVSSEVRLGDGRLELVGIESADPHLVADSIDQLSQHCYRLRAIGSIAISLCQVAAGRLDSMLSLRSCRSVDAAAAQLIAREAGASVSFPAGSGPLAAPLDLTSFSPVVAALSEECRIQLESVLGE